jgi:hypothetical protein
MAWRGGFVSRPLSLCAAVPFASGRRAMSSLVIVEGSTLPLMDVGDSAREARSFGWNGSNIALTSCDELQALREFWLGLARVSIDT